MIEIKLLSAQAISKIIHLSIKETTKQKHIVDTQRKKKKGIRVYCYEKSSVQKGRQQEKNINKRTTKHA